MDCALTKRRRSCISLPHLRTSRSSLMNLRCLLRVIRSGSLSLHREMSRWTWLDRCSARRSQSGWLLSGGKEMPKQPLGVQVCKGCVRSRRVISSALAETKRPALSCWAHSSLYSSSSTLARWVSGWPGIAIALAWSLVVFALIKCFREL